ncbi:hypothetical protein BpHYR1_049878, partial [Brachionus plicatilis]
MNVKNLKLETKWLLKKSKRQSLAHKSNLFVIKQAEKFGKFFFDWLPVPVKNSEKYQKSCKNLELQLNMNDHASLKHMHLLFNWSEFN